MVVAAIALIVAVKNRSDSRRSADATELGVIESKRSADAAEQSAADVKRSAEAAEAIAAIDRAVRHDSCGPAHPGAIRSYRKPCVTVSVPSFGEIILARAYRVQARGLYERGGTTDLFGPEFIRAGMPKEFHIETRPLATDPRAITAIEFRFWPPAGPSGVAEWSCQCGADEDASDGHWSFQVPVEPPAQRLIDDGWRVHVARYPGHRKNDAMVPVGWLCEGDGGEQCDVTSSALGAWGDQSS